MSAFDIANQFVEQYYTVMDSNPANLSGLYTPESMLTFDGEQIQGADLIIRKFQSIGKTEHRASSLDAQPSFDGNNLIVFCSGEVVANESEPVRFAQTFQLVSTGESYFILNNIFRTNLA